MNRQVNELKGSINSFSEGEVGNTAHGPARTWSVIVCPAVSMCLKGGNGGKVGKVEKHEMQFCKQRRLK